MRCHIVKNTFFYIAFSAILPAVSSRCKQNYFHEIKIRRFLSRLCYFNVLTSIQCRVPPVVLYFIKVISFIHIILSGNWKFILHTHQLTCRIKPHETPWVSMLSASSMKFISVSHMLKKLFFS